MVILVAALASGADRLAESASPGSKRPPSAATKQPALAYAKLPLAFTENAGQHDGRVRYAAQAGGAGIFLTRREAVVALGKGRRGLALRLAFLDANPEATLSGGERSPGRVNYLIGNDASRWQQNLPTYREVVYRGLWPGINMAVRGRGGQLKYEFRLAPGADPGRIRLAYRGQERLSLGTGGELRLETALGVLRDSRPASYQTIAGRRVAVESRFLLGRGGAYRFALGAYDRRSPLVIDPGLLYSTFLGGSGDEVGLGIALDGAGSAYVTGETTSTAFPTTAGAFDTTHNGGKRVRDVLQKQQAENEVLVLGRLDRAAQTVGGFEEFFGEREIVIASV
jgi:Beta-propeller repeat